MLKNSNGVPLSVAVWLATDNYDHNPSVNSDKKYISATSLLKPLKAIVLGKVIPQEEETDVIDLIPSRLGTAVHDQIEAAWKEPNRALQRLDIDPTVRDRITVNGWPINEEAIAAVKTGDEIPVVMEKRGFRDLLDWTVGGKFDFVIDGRLTDFKTTKTYSWISGTNIPDYVLQGSIYRWLHPDIITHEQMSIAYIFTDWIKQKAVADPKKYPPQPIMEGKYPLMTLKSTEEWITNRLQQINKGIELYNSDPLSQDKLPVCTKEELWQNDSVWKYFKDPAKRTRSTKNFDNPTDAHARNAADGGVGVVVEVPGEVKRCRYCNARPVCLQAVRLTDGGLLK